MREILFRGKRIDDGKWLYGLYSDERVHDTDFPCIMSLEEIIDDGDWAVSPDTVGQYTGLTDKNGKKIFEGNILRNKQKQENQYAVSYNSNITGFVAHAVGNTNKLSTPCMNIGTMISYEVIGDIYDNPELLEVQND